MRRRQTAFTLIELLVVIGIMILLAGILLPVVMKAYGKAVATRMQSDLAAIEGALNAYRQDHGAYPPVRIGTYVPPASSTPQPLANSADRPNPRTGAQVLCWALIGPGNAREAPAPAVNVYRKQDGKDGPGLRVRYTAGEDGTFGTGDDSMGKSYGPYLNPEQFRYGVPGDPITNAPGDVLLFCLLDRNDQPILYFPASNAKPNIRAITTTPSGVVQSYVDQSEVSRFDADDNLLAVNATPATALKKMRLIFGDRDFNGLINGEEQAVEHGFRLWCAGADDTFGPRGDEMPPRSTAVADITWEDVAKCDDVTLPAFR